MARSAYSILRGICIRLMIRFRPARPPLLSAQARGAVCATLIGYESLDVFAEHIAFDIDRRAGAFGAERGHLEGVRDKLATESPVADSKHGEAHAVDRYRALLDQVARLAGRRLEGA